MHKERQENAPNKNEKQMNKKVHQTAAAPKRDQNTREERNRISHAGSALAETEARRQKSRQRSKEIAPERDGRGGLDPTRFGDWEVNGRAVDF